jgi:hypothetical protein
MTNDINNKIEALTAEVERLKAAQPTPVDRVAEGKWRDLMHQQSEARASGAASTFFSRADLAAMRAASPDTQAIVRDHRNAPRGPAYQVPTSQPVSNVRGPGGGGWVRETPLRNGLGQGK